MKNFINYIRSCFCKHETEMLWEYKTPISCRYCAIFRCKKCGYVQKINN